MTIINPNHSGRNSNGGYAYRSLIEPEPGDFHPESKYWRLRSEKASAELEAAMGIDEYDTWFEAAISDSDTWQQIAVKLESKLHDYTERKAIEETAAEHKLDVDCIRYAGAW